jgi:hypothetical protein
MRRTIDPFRLLLTSVAEWLASGNATRSIGK